MVTLCLAKIQAMVSETCHLNGDLYPFQGAVRCTASKALEPPLSIC